MADRPGPGERSTGRAGSASRFLPGQEGRGASADRGAAASGPGVLRLLAAWLPVLLFEALVFYLSSRPNLQVPELVPNADKVAHFLEYAAAGGLLFRGFRLTGVPRLPALIGAVVLASGLGVADELSQRHVPGRSCSVFDWMADTLGAISGAWIGRLLESRIPGWLWSLMTASGSR